MAGFGRHLNRLRAHNKCCAMTRLHKQAPQWVMPQCWAVAAVVARCQLLLPAKRAACCVTKLKSSPTAPTCVAVVVAHHCHCKAKGPLWLLRVNLGELQVQLACRHPNKLPSATTIRHVVTYFEDKSSEMCHKVSALAQ